MTIEEIIDNSEIGNHPYYHSYLTHEILAICQEIRKLTIEECKSKAKVLKIVEDINNSIFSDDVFQIEPYYFEKYEAKLYTFTIDITSFPTDLNNINI